MAETAESAAGNRCLSEPLIKQFGLLWANRKTSGLSRELARESEPLRVTAVLERALAFALLLRPSWPSELLFGQTPQMALTAILGRFFGGALLSLAIACWWAGNEPGSPTTRDVVKTMLFYSGVAAALLVYARMGLALAGMLLWPGVVVHGILGAWCAASLQGK